ncbi:MAG: CIA30 family protein [Hyphomicrobiales bacterium]
MELNPDWEYVADRVMCGVSEGGIQRGIYSGRTATILCGKVSLEDSGGIVQMTFDLRPDWPTFNTVGWNGVELTISGNDEARIYGCGLKNRRDFGSHFEANLLPNLNGRQFSFHSMSSLPTKLKQILIVLRCGGLAPCFKQRVFGGSGCVQNFPLSQLGFLRTK